MLQKKKKLSKKELKEDKLVTFINKSNMAKKTGIQYGMNRFFVIFSPGGDSFNPYSACGIHDLLFVWS